MSSLFFVLSSLFCLSFQSAIKEGCKNELENLINEERNSQGLPSLTCDQGMRYVAYQHAINQVDNNFQAGGGCNLHSWAGDRQCCFTSDFSNSECMWRKPNEIYGDKRRGYEISAGGSGSMTAQQAIAQWKGSSGHNAVMMTQGGWSKLTHFGCFWRGGFAHCWFTNDQEWY